MIGTTQFTNAVIARRALLPVGIVRLALPATSAIPPLTDWPKDLVDAIGRNVTLVRGGYEFDGREIAPLDESAVADAARAMRAAGLHAAAVTSVFSPVNGDMERRAAEIIRNEVPDIAVSLSCELGQFGLLPRENSTIINDRSPRSPRASSRRSAARCISLASMCRSSSARTTAP